MAACSSGTRIVGCILVFALVVQLYIDMEGTKISFGRVKTFVMDMLKAPKKILSVLVCPLGAFAYMTFLNFFCGDAWAYKNVQIAWREEEYPDDMFIKPDDAPSKINASTVVIVVDVNRPQRTECPELLEKCKTVVVFDHHRRQSDTITGAVLSYVDPYASSASEMITEMIQYVDDNIKLKAFEADALYAGINIDTDGFNSKSGPRTFEAAAFLRRHGADVTRVRKMLRSNMNEYKEIAKAVSRVEVYKDAFAISIFNGDGIDTPTVGGAKTANDLLDISGIKASFVITPYEDKIYVSARSIDEVNVQLVMEKLGGGGHISIAGAQFTDCTIDQAINKIKLTLDNMIKDGEI